MFIAVSWTLYYRLIIAGETIWKIYRLMVAKTASLKEAYPTSMLKWEQGVPYRVQSRAYVHKRRWIHVLLVSAVSVDSRSSGDSAQVMSKTTCNEKSGIRWSLSKIGLYFTFVENYKRFQLKPSFHSDVIVVKPMKAVNWESERVSNQKRTNRITSKGYLFNAHTALRTINPPNTCQTQTYKHTYTYAYQLVLGKRSLRQPLWMEVPAM